MLNLRKSIDCMSGLAIYADKHSDLVIYELSGSKKVYELWGGDILDGRFNSLCDAVERAERISEIISR